MSQLRFWKQFEDRRSQQMGGRMPVNFEGLRVFVSKKTEIGIFFERLGEIDEIAVGFRDQRCIRQPQADQLRHIEGGSAF